MYFQKNLLPRRTGLFQSPHLVNGLLQGLPEPPVLGDDLLHGVAHPGRCLHVLVFLFLENSQVLLRLCKSLFCLPGPGNIFLCPGPEPFVKFFLKGRELLACLLFIAAGGLQPRPELSDLRLGSGQLILVLSGLFFLGFELSGEILSGLCQLLLQRLLPLLESPGVAGFLFPDLLLMPAEDFPDLLLSLRLQILYILVPEILQFLYFFLCSWRSAISFLRSCWRSPTSFLRRDSESESFCSRSVFVLPSS